MLLEDKEKMKCELCDQNIKQGFYGLFVKDHEKGIKSAALSYIGRNPWVHKICYWNTCRQLKEKKKLNTMEKMMIDDYEMMQVLGDIK